MSAARLKITKLTPTIGAELSGVDLNSDLEAPGHASSDFTSPVSIVDPGSGLRRRQSE